MEKEKMVPKTDKDISEFKTQEKPGLDTPPVPSEEPAPPPKIDMETDVKLPITDADKDKYFNCIITNQPFHEVLYAFDGKLKVGMRTRTVKESEEVLKYLNRLVTNKEIDFYPDFQNKHIMGHVAFAVTSLNDRNVDSGTIEDRLKRIVALDNQLFIIMIEMLKRFDDKMQRLRDEALKPNF
jgi:hypothetical protein